MQEKISGTIKGHIVRAFEKSQDWEADIFGIGNAFQRSIPSYWKEIEGDWDHIYKELDLEVTVTSSIRQFGLMEEPPFFEYHVTE